MVGRRYDERMGKKVFGNQQIVDVVCFYFLFFVFYYFFLFIFSFFFFIFLFLFFYFLFYLFFISQTPNFIYIHIYRKHHQKMKNYCIMVPLGQLKKKNQGL